MGGGGKKEKRAENSRRLVEVKENQEGLVQLYMESAVEYDA